MRTVFNISTLALSAMVILLSGCSKEVQINETGDQARAIGVKPEVSTGESTRAAVTTTTLPGGTNFGLYGFQGTNLYTDGTTTLSNQKVSNSGTLDGTVYWPTTNFSSNAITFYAYYPHQTSFGTNITNVVTTSGYPVISWVTPTTTDVDLMFAKSSSYSAVPTGNPKGVASLEFNHILSHFDVQAKLVDNTVAKGQNVSVTKVELKSIALNGTYNNGNTSSWSSVGTTGNRTITKTTSLDATFKSVSDFLILPQSNSGLSMTVTYTLNGAPKTLAVAAAKIPTFEIGKKHILEITFTVSDTEVVISFNPVSVKPWGAGSGTTVTENQEVI